MLRIIIATLILLVANLSALAQDETLQSLLVEQHEAIQKPSRGSAEALVGAFLKSGLPEAKTFLLKWRDREVWVRKSDGGGFNRSVQRRFSIYQQAVLFGQPFVLLRQIDICCQRQVGRASNLYPF